MSKQGATKEVGAKEKSFAGPGVEGQKGAEEEGAEEKPVKKPAFDKEGASHVVTMRGGKAVTVWFKDGKEIGVE